MDDELVIIRGWRGKEFPIRNVTKSDLEQALAVFWEGVDRYKLAEIEECSINTVNSAINRYYKAVKRLITKRFIPV